MRYYSTKQPDITVSMREAVMACVPQTGGLYLPASLPTIPEAFVRNMTDMALQEIAYATTNVFLGEDLDSSEIKSVIEQVTMDHGVSSPRKNFKRYKLV